jgi:probable phosphoglycerate mutase
MSEINIILVRHGEASASWSEDPDPGLSKNGINQAKILCEDESLKNLQDFKFISSPRQRAQETSSFLSNKLNKVIEINNVFDEIPAKGVLLKDKMDWLKGIASMPIRDLPISVQEWNGRIIDTILSINQDSIIFTHFMVMNAVVTYAKQFSKLVNISPDYISIIKITVRDSQIISLKVGDQKKTKINI